MSDNRSLPVAIIGDGRPLLIFTGLILLLTGLFVILQSFTGHFLPHDVAYLGLDADQLGEFNNGTITSFMFHDRISFGGSIMAVGMVYMWMAEFPLRQGEAWAWYLFLFSGVIGFGNFFTYLGYGYFDSWHGIATAMLLPFFVAGMKRSRSILKPKASGEHVFPVRQRPGFKSAYGLGVTLLLFSGVGMFLAGITISAVGMTIVFVPEDLAFMDITVCGLEGISPRLKPLIAHDRAAFGGGLATIGLMFFVIVLCAERGKNLWQILLVSMVTGFATAIGIHFVIGYTTFSHLAPAYLGAFASFAGLVLTFRRMTQPRTYVLS